MTQQQPANLVDIDKLTSLFGNYKTPDAIPESFFKKHITLYGTITTVMDGDTCRFSCISALDYFFKPVIKTGHNRDNTLSIRLSGIDAPETAKPGKEGQPFAKEAQDYLTAAVLHQKDKVVLLDKDQYGRILGMIQLRTSGPLFPTYKNMCLDMVEQGLATVNKGQGAQHGGQKNEFIQAKERHVVIGTEL